MHTLVIDTNIIVSSLLSNSYPRKIIFEIILEGKAFLSLSQKILTEYKGVISRKKFAQYPDFRKESMDLIAQFEAISLLINPNLELNLLSDEADNKFIELALTVHADFIITGNLKHFPFTRIENTEIISPQKYWNTYWS